MGGQRETGLEEVGKWRGQLCGGRRTTFVCSAGGQGVEEVLDEHVLLGVVPQGLGRVHAVEIAAAALAPHDVSARFQVRDDLVGRALGDADVVGNLPRGVARIVEDVAQHQSVIGDECPFGRSLNQRRTWLGVGLDGFYHTV